VPDINEDVPLFLQVYTLHLGHTPGLATLYLLNTHQRALVSQGHSHAAQASPLCGTAVTVAQP
jgi:hypothetical protein